jgi:hypothetical protein
MPVHQEQQGSVSLAISAGSSGVEQRVDLVWRQVLASPGILVGSAPWWGNFPTYDAWCGSAALP